MKLLSIFIATTHHLKLLVVGLISVFFLVIALFFYWVYSDMEEVRLRYRVLAQQEKCFISPKEQLLVEQQRLIDYKAEHDTFIEPWLRKLLLGERAKVSILGKEPNERFRN